ncbi:unnamed protein product [Acanthoscelides obtectus]|uniref:Uncharacterized protein n=1 Tax=Acanthoscelides obtectus TaxID=200917 RepID=A0A9P0PMH7_ACAOB|nr:unnamed protein product [Acanthoscelides obtectus]CAK1676382.1 hypothetical protein AOBTE_LOCUS30723 [Acanthoscelides obtectus]
MFKKILIMFGKLRQLSTSQYYQMCGTYRVCPESNRTESI